MDLLHHPLARRAAAKVNPVYTRRIQSWSRILFWHLAVPLAFAILVLFFFPSRARFEFSTDEGINLMKAMLVEQDYALYKEIWSDQPPLFTYLLAGVFQIFGLKVGAGRMLVLFLSCTLLWAAFQIMAMIWGKRAALAGAFLFFVLPKYLTLSVSAMVGLPSLAFAMLALLPLVVWHRNRNPLLLILSAVALSLSVMTKLITGFLAPIFLLGIGIESYLTWRKSGTWRDLLLPSVLWGTAFVVFTFGLGYLLIGPENISQVLDTHLAGAQVKDLREHVYFTINYHLQQAWPVLLLALLGVVYTLRARLWLALYPLAWMVIAYLLLFFHRPVWFHHQLLVTIPAAMLGGIALYEGMRWGWSIVRTNVQPNLDGGLRAAAVIGLLALMFTVRLPESITFLKPLPSLETSGLEVGPLTERFLIRMIKYAPETRWVVTDLPMFAFRARLPVPPNLVVFSVKRFETGNLTEADVIHAIQEYRPEQILLGRYHYPQVEAFIANDYYMIHSKDLIKHYIRNDLLR